jgi:hypothetical protein
MKSLQKMALMLLAVFLISTVASIPLNSIGAQAATSQKTYAIADAIPNVIGLGETTLLKCGITEALESADYGWTDVKIIVTKPDGTNQTLGPFKTDSTGSTYTEYTPTALGNYTITTLFPEQPAQSTFFNYERGTMVIKGTTMAASTASCTLTVREEASQTYPSHSLPTEYWSRPIDDQLREWWSISGNWVVRPDNSIADYNADAPETAHVLWAQDLTTGGISGGLQSSQNQVDITTGMNTGDAYEGKFTNSIILNGVLYYQSDPGTGTYGSLGTPSIVAVDLHTGETLWTRNNTVLTRGQELYWNSYNVDATYSYVWSQSGTTWTAYDPFDGSWCYTFTNVPSGQATVTGPSGEILIYVIDTTHNWMALWNSTQAGLSAGGATEGTASSGSWASNVMLRTLDVSGRDCYSWNVTIPAGLTYSTSFFAPILKVYNTDRVVSTFFNQTKVRVWALDISDLTNSSTSTSKLYDQWWDAPSEWLDGSNTLHYVGATNYVSDATYGDGVIGIWSKELRTHYGFSVENGKYLWATESENYADAYGWGNAEHTWYYAYGNLYSIGVGGTLYAYDLATGTTTWTYNLTDAYGEPVTGNNWWGWIDLIADGKIYVGTLEHSAENPMPRGAPYVAVNATNGAEIWRVNGMFRETRWGGNGIIGDSIIATMDTYDQRVYAIGKGSTQTTIAAGPKTTTQGSSVVIEGNVMDKSPGLTTTAMELRFPSGVAAVSDASQSQWMLYVYKQFEKPTNATGVTVAINVVDANGNYRTVGTTTSDMSGYYSFSWTPDITGKYTAIASFTGSGSYYGSSAETSFAVDAAPATATPQPTAAPSAADLYFLPAIIGVIIAILVVGAVLALLVTKKP